MDFIENIICVHVCEKVLEETQTLYKSMLKKTQKGDINTCRKIVANISSTIRFIWMGRAENHAHPEETIQMNGADFQS